MVNSLLALYVSNLFPSFIIFQLSEGLLGLATIYVQQENMAEAKKLMTRSLELAMEVVGQKHHFCSAIFAKVSEEGQKI